MRYPPGHKQAARQRLLDTAARVVKKEGFAATGLADLMAAAGVTTGAFYTQFRSRSELLGAIVERDLARLNAAYGRATARELRRLLRRYLSIAHVEHPEDGCPLPSLAAEIARADEPTREAFETLLVEQRDLLTAILGGETPAWAALAQVVGAVMLARAVLSPTIREAILDAARQNLEPLLAAAPEKPPAET